MSGRVFQPDAIGEVNTPSLLPLPSAVFAHYLGLIYPTLTFGGP